MIFIFTFIFLLVLCYVYDYRGIKRGKSFWWIFTLILLICIAGLRYEIGADSIRYENEYRKLPDLSTISAKDFTGTRYAPLYVLLSAACRSVSTEFVLLQFVLATIVNTTFFYFIRKHSDHIFVGALLYYFFLYDMLNMQVLRESVAVCIFLWSWPYFRDCKWIKYYMFCIMAFLFHLSSMALFLLPLLRIPGIVNLFKLGKRTIIICFVLLVVSFAVKYFLYDFIKMISFTEAMTDRAITYEKDDTGGNTLNIIGSLSWLIKLVVYPLIALYCLKGNGLLETTKHNRVFVMISILSIYVSVMSVGVMILSRYNNYFLIFSLIIMSDWIFTLFRMFGKAFRLNCLYWILLLIPMFGIHFYSTYFASNKAGTIKTYEMYYPYSNQIEKEHTEQQKKIVKINRRWRWR